VHSPILWITLGNLLYLTSYSVRDILTLRILTVLASSLIIPYYALQPQPPVASIGWSAILIAINVIWIVVLAVERRPVHLDPNESRLRQLSFPSLTPREARRLFATGTWVEIDPGESIVEHDNRAGHFSVILHGCADVIVRRTKIAELGAGQFVGAIDECAIISPIDVVVRERVCLKCWGRDHLTAFMAARPDVALALERSVGIEVRRLLNDTILQLRPGRIEGNES
jgi:hypothetical protein